MERQSHGSPGSGCKCRFPRAGRRSVSYCSTSIAESSFSRTPEPRVKLPRDDFDVTVLSTEKVARDSPAGRELEASLKNAVQLPLKEKHSKKPFKDLFSRFMLNVDDNLGIKILKDLRNNTTMQETRNNINMPTSVGLTVDRPKLGSSQGIFSFGSPTLMLNRSLSSPKSKYLLQLGADKKTKHGNQAERKGTSVKEKFLIPNVPPIAKMSSNDDAAEVHVQDSTSFSRRTSSASGDSILSEVELNPSISKRASVVSDDTVRHANISLSISDKSNLFFLRVYRENGTFGTIVCPECITTTDLLQLAGRKFFLSNIENYHLVVLKANRVRRLHPEERPVEVIQSLLRRAGYTNEDIAGTLYGGDITFLCRMVLASSNARPIPDRVYQDNIRDPKYMSLYNTDLEDIPEYVAERAPEIETLDLRFSGIGDVNLQFIEKTKNLKVLEVSSMLFAGQLIPDFLHHFHNLCRLDLSKNALKSFDLDVSFMPNLLFLDLCGNQLTELPSSLSNSNLRTLILGTNSLVNFDTIIPSLIHLDLSYNMLESISEDFCKLQNLDSLLLNNNYLIEVPEGMTELNISYLDISNNFINSVLAVAAPSLKVLLASQTQFLEETVVPASSHFVKSPSPANKLTTRSLPNLEILELRSRPHARLHDHLRMESLKRIDLKETHLFNIPDYLFNGMPNIEMVNLDRNDLSRLPVSLGKLKNLRHLSVADNSISALPYDLIDLQSLHTLDLHSNNLKILSTVIWSLRSLKVLNISSNLLEQLPSCPSQEISEKYAQGSRGNIFEGNIYEPTNLNRDDFDPESSRSSESGFGTSALFKAGRASRPPLVIARLDELYAADNRLTEDVFDDIMSINSLQVLNLSYNLITEIPQETFTKFPKLRELCLSGNRISTLPQDDLKNARCLRRLFVNSNRLHSLPAELSKASNLEILDVAANSLRYNVNNWPYDWNWRWNQKLRYLNLSSNRRLDIRRPINQVIVHQEEDLSDFCVLPKLQILSLIDITLMTTAIPDESENCRVRTYGSLLTCARFGIADSLGENGLNIGDLVADRFMGNSDSFVIGIFDGESRPQATGNKVSKLVQENFLQIFRKNLNLMKEDKNLTIPDALRRSFFAVHGEIGNTLLLTPEEIKHTFIGYHSQAAAHLSQADRDKYSGATVLYMAGKKLYVASVGGVRVIVSKSTGEFRVISGPVHPWGASELHRIKESGGVVKNGKLNGYMSYSRMIGGYSEGSQITPAPEIYEYDMVDPKDVIIVGTANLWDYVPVETACDLVRAQANDPMRAALKLRDFARAYGMPSESMCLVISYPDHQESTLPSMDPAVSLTVDKKRRQQLPQDPVLARLGVEVAPPLGDVTLVFTDIKNSTLLWEAMTMVMRSAIKLHNSIMRRSMRLLEGYEVKTEGDAFIVSFHSPIKALIWCLTVQQQLMSAQWPQQLLEVDECAPVYDKNGDLLYRGLSVRMGIHFGRPVHELDPITKRMDYFGPMVNRAARICAIAFGGQIAASGDYLSILKKLKKSQRLAETMPLEKAFDLDVESADEILRDLQQLDQIGYVSRDLGELKLKGIENTEEVHVVFPAALQDRWNHPQNEALDEDIVVSPQVANAEDSVPALLYDMALNLRGYSMRLEALSRLHSPLSKHDDDASRRRTDRVLNPSVSAAAIQGYMNRIEDSLASLVSCQPTLGDSDSASAKSSSLAQKRNRLLLQSQPEPEPISLSCDSETSTPVPLDEGSSSEDSNWLEGQVTRFEREHSGSTPRPIADSPNRNSNPSTSEFEALSRRSTIPAIVHESFSHASPSE